MEDIDTLYELAENSAQDLSVRNGTSAPNPVLTTLKYFREEYEAHIATLCPAGVCCALCASPSTRQVSGLHPVRPQVPCGGHIRRSEEAACHQPGSCIKCGACATACRFGAVSKSRDGIMIKVTPTEKTLYYAARLTIQEVCTPRRAHTTSATTRASAIRSCWVAGEVKGPAALLPPAGTRVNESMESLRDSSPCTRPADGPRNAAERPLSDCEAPEVAARARGRSA
jgi:ferredoxin